MRRYFGYVRVSTPKQGQGVSLQEQRAAIEAHAARNDLAIVEWFEEKETAAKEGRNVFARMLSELERRRADGVVIHKIDRSARNLWDWANLGKLFDRGIDVQFAHDSIDLHSRGGRLSADIMAVVAADYVRNLRDEVRKGFYGRLKQGLYPIPAPLGYVDRGAGRPKEPNPVSAPLVKWAFERYAQGGIGLCELAEELHRRGLRSRRGGRTSVNGVSVMLHNPFYIGIVRIKRTNENFEGIHEPLITKAMFDRVQEVLKGKTPRRVQTHDFIFRRLIRCGSCGRRLVGEHKKKRYVYYRCYNAACRGSVVRETDVDAELGRVARLVLLTPGEARDLRDLAEEDLLKTGEVDKSRESQLQMRITQCDDRLNRLTDALVDGLIEKDAYEARKLKLLNERHDLLDGIENVSAGSTPSQMILEYLELPNIAQLRYEMAEPYEKREIGAAIAWNLVAHGRKLEIMLKSPYREIANWRLSECGGPYRGRLGTRTRKLFEILKACAERQGQDNMAGVSKAA